MSIADELSKLEDLRRRGVLSESEFAQAKAAVLAGTTTAPADSASEHLAEHLAEVRQQNELARLDREWQMEREQYLVAGRRGVRHVPTTGASLAGAGVVGVFGVFWTIFALAITSSAPSDGPFLIAKVIFPVFGVLFTVFGVGMGIRSYQKAQQYDAAFARYQQRRRSVTSGAAAPRPASPGEGDDRIQARD